jgi:putative ABC transport system permease protein
MSTRALGFRFALRELRAGPEGFYVFIACLVIGVAAIAGVQSLSRGLVASLHADGRYILGGDIAVRTIYAPPAAEQMAFFRTLGRVSGTAFVRAMARRGDESRATLAEVKAVDDHYPLYGALETGDGAGRALDARPQALLANKDGRFGALAAPDLLPRLELPQAKNRADLGRIGGEILHAYRHH